ncbi:VCBS repeat-containing protein, partial [candidate division WOR-3 bacterium]|nr:VCBS repeat-containing protein [candidate division WOR-3 bacterium]
INDLLNSATESIFFIIYSWSYYHPFDETVKAKFDEGLKIAGVYDNLNAGNNGWTTYHYDSWQNYGTGLEDYGIDVRKNNVSKIDHNKVFIVDKEWVVTGSYNWSKSAEESNDENSFWIKDDSIAREYIKRFKQEIEYFPPDSTTADSDPYETTSPSTPSWITATGENNAIIINWSTVSASDFSRYYIFVSSMHALNSNFLIGDGIDNDGDGAIDEDLWATSGDPNQLIAYVVKVATQNEITITKYDDDLKDIQDGTTYYIAIVAVDKWSNESGVAYTSVCPNLKPPAPITDLTASTGLNEGEINLTWISPGDDGTTGEIIGGKYRIKYSTNSNDNWQAPYSLEWTTNTSPGNIETRVLTGLIPGATYYIRIWTRDEIEGNWSGLSLGATAYAKIISPSPITDLKVVDAGWRGVTLSWTATGDDNKAGKIIDGGYWIKYSSGGAIDNETDWNNAPYQIKWSTDTSPGSIESKIITGLTNGVTYWFAIKIRDENEDNWSPLSTVSSSGTPYNTSPYDFSLSSPTDGEIIFTRKPTFYWQNNGDPDLIYGDAVTFEIWYSTKNDFSIKVISSGLKSAQFIPENSLMEDVTYWWKVKVRDEEGIEKWSDNVWVVRIDGINSLPEPFNLITPSGIISTGYPLFSWQATTDPDPWDTLSYVIWYSTKEDFSIKISSQIKTNSYQPEVPLVEGITHWWCVRAVDSKGGERVSSSTWTVRYLFPPGKVTGLVAETGCQIKLSWISPGDDGYNGDITDGSWQIVYSSNSFATPDTAEFSLEWATNAVQGTIHFKTITGLKPRTTYYFWIRTRDEAGNWSLWSDTVSAVSGSFYFFTSLSNVEDTLSLVCGDIDNDGDLDIVAGNDSQPNRVYKNNGDGTFISAWTSAESDGTVSVALGDFNNDGYLDLGVGNYSQSNRIYENNGDGTFFLIWSSTETENTSAIAWGDIDNDGDMDFICGNDGQANRVYENKGKGIFISVWSSEETDNTGSIALGDYNNDGFLDLAVGNIGQPDRIYENNGDGTFTLIWDSTETEDTYSVVWGDIDNDGDLDLIAGNPTRVYRNDGEEVFTNVWNFLEASVSVSAGDFDNDGYLDIAAGCWNYGFSDSIHRNNQDGTFTSYCKLDEEEYTMALIWVDIDNDGDLDLIDGNEIDSGIGGRSKIYKSLEADFGNINSQPLKPTGLWAEYQVDEGALDFGCDLSIYDVETFFCGLYYNIRIGTTPGGNEIASGVYGSPLLGNLSFRLDDEFDPVFSLKPLLSTTYYFSIQIIDSGLKASAWSDEKSFFLPKVDVPGNFYGEAISTTSIIWRWSKVKYAHGFRILTSTGGVINSFLYDTTFYFETDFSPNQKVERSLEAYNNYSSASTEVTSVYTLANSPNNLSLSCWGNAIKITWESNGNPSGTKYGISVSTDNFYQSISTPIVFSSNLQDCSTIFFDLSYDTTYWIRVWAYNEEGKMSNWISQSIKTLSETTMLYPPYTAFKIEKEISETNKVILYVSSYTFSIPVSAEIRPVDSSHSDFGLVNQADNNLSAEEIIEPYDFIVKDENGNLLDESEFGDYPTIRFKYPDSYNLAQENLLRIVWLDENIPEWKEISNFTVNTVENYIEVNVEHLSIYKLISKVTSAGFSNLIIYPQPFKPKEAKNGELKFINLPGSVTLKIYSITGQLIYKEEYENTKGGIVWEGVNSAGKRVATGIYLYLIEDSKGNKKTGRISLIR